MIDSNLRSKIIHRFQIIIDTLSPLYIRGSQNSIEMLKLIEVQGTIEIQLAERENVSPRVIENELLSNVINTNNMLQYMLKKHNKTASVIEKSMKKIIKSY
tara:strand:+ start:2455 stop:2757 length:303 start_codon:yes stop_codon:yes gene_type:complete